MRTREQGEEKSAEGSIRKGKGIRIGEWKYSGGEVLW